MIHKPVNKIGMYFGNASTCTIPHKSTAYLTYCSRLKGQFNLAAFVTQEQVHGVDGMVIDKSHSLPSDIMHRQTVGDWLITDQLGVGIAVFTADCLPLVFYAPQVPVIAVAHAGWRGSVGTIAQIVIEKLRSNYAVKPEAIHVYLGAAAGSCCYQVGSDFVNNISNKEHAQKVFLTRANNQYFDLSLLNKLQLIDCGIDQKHINVDYNDCTICDDRYHSYRRSQDKPVALRQLTMVWIEQ